MELTLGPLTIPNIYDLKYSARRINQPMFIPYGPVMHNETIGIETVEYQFNGAIYNDSVDPKDLRQQLTELFDNTSYSFVYILFDEDPSELSGWFILDTFSTSIQPMAFNYEFSITVRRLSLDEGLVVGLYAKDDNPLVGDYVVGERRWAGLFSGSITHITRPMEQGTILIPINTTSYFFPTTYSSYVSFYNKRCRVYDTKVRGSLYNSSDPNKTGWVERFGVGGSFEGDVVISNGLVRITFSYPNTAYPRYHIECWTGSAWARSCLDFKVLYANESLTTSKLSRNSSIYYNPPVITYLSPYKIEFIQYMFQELTDTFLIVKNILRAGTYFIEKEIIARKDAINQLSFLDLFSWSISGTTNTSNCTSTQFTTTSGYNVSAGFLHNYTPTLSPLLNGKIFRLGYEAPKNSIYNVGVFAAPNPLPSGTTLSNLGAEFLSNSEIELILVNPRYL